MITVEQLLFKFVNTFKLPYKVIRRRDDSLYLTRYYISHSTDSKYLPGIYIHCFHSSDQDLELHDHPWEKAMAIILSGSYREEVRQDDNYVLSRIMRPGNINYIKGDTFHRVDLASSRVWTLFISWNKKEDWGFWNRHTNKYTQWEEFEKQKKNKPNLRLIV